MTLRRGQLGGLLLLLAALLVLSALAVQVALWRPLPVAGEAPDDGYHRARGVVHVHTTLSDGGGTPDEVIAAARAAGLDFVGITDHNHVDGKSYEGTHDGVVVLVGSEISTVRGHLLGLGLREDPAFRFSRSGLEDLEDVRDLGGFSFAAHPFSAREDLRWTGWDLPGPWGMELINGDSEWRRAGPRAFLALALYRLNPAWALLQGLGAPDEALARWDRMLAERDVVGLYGADAHSRLPVTRSWALRFPSYEALFSLVSTHVLLDAPLSGDAGEDRAAILGALRSGRSYTGIDALAPAGGFTFFVDSPTGERWTMGESAPLEDGLVAVAGGRVPAGARVRLLRDGRVLEEAPEALRVPLPGEGVYRVEVRVEGWATPWIISNPIGVHGRPGREARRKAARWPEPPAPTGPVELLDDFEAGTVFQAGHDPASAMEEPIVDPTGGRDGGGAARIGFRLGEPTPDSPHVFVAIVSWEHRRLEGREGLSFWIRGDGVHRTWVQVRDENPASADEGTEWWFGSVKTSTRWRQVALPFATLRSINPRTDGRLDLDAVRAIVFVIDKGAMKPGSQGTIWIDDVGVY